MENCSQQTNIPILNPVTEPCDGFYTPTTCIIHIPELPTLNLLAGSTLSEVITALTLQQQNLLEYLDTLQGQVDTLIVA